MTYSSAYTLPNLTTSVAIYLAQKFNEAGWAIYWQASSVMSGVATVGEVTFVPEFPDEPSRLKLPPNNVMSGVSRTEDIVLIPAFSISIVGDPIEQQRAGIGEDLFETVVSFSLEGFVMDQAQHLTFPTMIRNWLRPGYKIPVYNFDADINNPPLLEQQLEIVQRSDRRLEMLNSPRPVRYFISSLFDVIYYD